MDSVEMFDPLEMVTVHVMFRREFGLAPPLVRSVRLDDRERIASVGEHVALLMSALAEHHGFEDARIWPVVSERVPPEAVRFVTDAAEQHHALDAALLVVSEALADFRDGATEAESARLADALEAVRGLVVRHMDFEEMYVLPLLHDHLTQAEWDRGIAEMSSGIDPERLPLYLGLILYEASQRFVEQTIAKMPLEVRPTIEELARQSFERQAQKVYGATRIPLSTEIPHV